MSGGRLLCVGPLDVESIWHVVGPMIDAAYAELDEPTPDVLTWLKEKKGLLWVYALRGQIVAACTTSLVMGRGGLALRLVAIGGEGMDIWLQCISAIEDYARVEGCYKIVADGRRGWKAFLADYRPKCVSFEKRL